MMALKFRDNFWDTQFTSTAGFDALDNRLKESKNLCAEMVKFLSSRAKIEEEYASKLHKLAAGITKQLHQETLRRSWHAMQDQVTHSAATHAQLAKDIELRSVELNNRLAEQQEKRKKMKKNMQDLQDHKKKCYTNTMTSKEQYFNKCKEAESLESSYLANKQAQKDNEKLQARKDKAQEEARKADERYQKDNNALEDSRKGWERAMESCCDLSEKLEGERVTFCRQELWVHLNLLAEQAVVDSDTYEVVRKTLENCKPTTDLNEFIKLRKTGSERPRAVEYESFYSGQRSSGSLATMARRSPNVEKPRLPPPPAQSYNPYESVDPTSNA